MRHLIRLAVVASMLLGLSMVAPGCVGETFGVSGGVAMPPLMVDIGPGLWAVEASDQPLFYSDGWYWLYSDGSWMRSHHRDRDFAQVDVRRVPMRLRTMHRPGRYARYHAPEGARLRRAPAAIDMRPPARIRHHHAATRRGRRAHRGADVRTYRHDERRSYRRDERRSYRHDERPGYRRNRGRTYRHAERRGEGRSSYRPSERRSSHVARGERGRRRGERDHR